MFIKTDGTLWGMGLNTNAQLGDGSTVNRSSPVQVASDVATVAAGSIHTMFIKNDGTLWAMGGNGDGELGDPSITSAHTTPLQVASRVAKVAAAGLHTMFIKTDGTLWATGSNSSGELGDGQVPANLPLANDVTSVGTGTAAANFFVKSDGTLWQQKNGTVEQVPGVSGVVDVYVGAYNQSRTYLKGDGTFWRLGNDNTSTQLASGVVAAGSGLSYAVWLKGDGTLWGQQLLVQDDGMIRFGDGTDPVQVANGVVSVSASGWHFLYVKEDQTLWGMGTAWLGLVPGSNYTNSPNAPVQLETGVAAAAANTNQNIYLKIDGTLWTRGQGWDDSTGPAAQVDSDVLSFASGGTGTLYVKADGILRFSPGVRGTLGTTVQLASNVTSVRGGTDGWAVYLQAAGAGTAPTIATSPQSAAVQPGAALTLQVNANGTGPLGYQWFKDGVAVSWARAAQYPIPYATAGDAGSYTVTVTNSAGSVTSAAATVSLSAGTLAQTITFSVLPDVTFTTTPITLTASSDSGLPVTFSVTGPATVSGNSLTLTGIGMVTIHASQSGSETYQAAPVVERSFEVTVAASGFAAWQATSFTLAEQGDPNISGPSAVYGLDGLPNLVKYALGLDPKVNATTGLPVVSTAATDWVYTYVRPSDRADITYEVEVSTNLQSWTTIGVVHEQVSVNGGQETWRARYPQASAPNVFFRLKITQL